jgi:hypothetical protein
LRYFTSGDFAFFSAMTTDCAFSSAPSELVWVWSMGNRSAAFSWPVASSRAASTLAISIKISRSSSAIFLMMVLKFVSRSMCIAPVASGFQMSRIVIEANIGVAPLA